MAFLLCLHPQKRSQLGFLVVHLRLAGISSAASVHVFGFEKLAKDSFEAVTVDAALPRINQPSSVFTAKIHTKKSKRMIEKNEKIKKDKISLIARQEGRYLLHMGFEPLVKFLF